MLIKSTLDFSNHFIVKYSLLYFQCPLDYFKRHLHKSLLVLWNFLYWNSLSLRMNSWQGVVVIDIRNLIKEFLNPVRVVIRITRFILFFLHFFEAFKVVLIFELIHLAL